MFLNQKIIFISWTKFSRHSDLLGQALGAEIFFIDNLISSRGILWKLFFLIDYFSKSFRTLKIIWKTRPAVVFIQNPPSLTAIVVVFFSKIFNFKVVVDSHNGAFERPWVSIPFHKWALDESDLVIVHNSELYNNLKRNPTFKDVKLKILNSRLSEFPGITKNQNGDPYMFVITSYSGDEPVFEMMEGIRLYILDNRTELKFKITGNFNKNPDLYRKYSQVKNIEFIGFVSEIDYNSHLVNAYGVISLSTRNDVQQFALMEAVGAEVPFISSKNSTNESLFNDRMILSENNALEIAAAIEKFVRERDRFYGNVLEIKRMQHDKWWRDFNEVKTFLSIT
ncbi:MAG: hypothetical protein OEM46_00290 [Ignavibacteria bacterium]|nr:hypothetical protein [Ignavibacteria bacterium]